jgi:hypothetical protein
VALNPGTSWPGPTSTPCGRPHERREKMRDWWRSSTSWRSSGAAGFEWYKDSCWCGASRCACGRPPGRIAAAYAAMLREDPAKWIGSCTRFRAGHRILPEPDSWQRLRDVLTTERTGAMRGSLTAWSMACATGEEAWTLAMLLERPRGRLGAIPATGPGPRIGVDPQALVQAEGGPLPAARRGSHPRGDGAQPRQHPRWLFRGGARAAAPARLSAGRLTTLREPAGILRPGLLPEPADLPGSGRAAPGARPAFRALAPGGC